MLKSIRFCFSLIALICLSVLEVSATHLRAGDITVTRQSCSNYRYIVTLHVYTKWATAVKFGGGTLNFGDGKKVTTNSVRNPPKIADTDDGGVGEVTYPVEHEFPGPGVYLITYYEQNRNEGILNISNSVETPFFIQTQIVIDPLLGCDNSPELLVPPIDQGCTGQTWYHNPGAYDRDGDSLSYELFVPKQAQEVDVSGYRDPNGQQFYVNIPYSAANQAGNGPPTFAINPVTGTITWDAPGDLYGQAGEGEYNIAFKIISWRKIKDFEGKSVWVSLGYVERDMQVVIKNCHNLRPEMKAPDDICVLAGTPVQQDIFATDPDGSPTGGGRLLGDSVKIQAYSEAFASPHTATISPGSAVPDSPVWQPTFSPNQQAHIQFNWQPTCRDVKEQPYLVVFKATDNGGPPLATFVTWKIRVVAPPPLWTSAVLNPGQRSAQLTWQPYSASCGGVPNTSTMQIWRRVDSYPFTPSNCVTGMPDNLGYILIATVPIGSTTYLDKGLAAGAQYCYRLVAEFPQPDGGDSYVSQEICVGPIKADAPVITKVTVDTTDTAIGQITVRWRSPFQALQSQFPKPYTFTVFRAEKASGKTNLKQVNPGQLSDSVFVDTGLNTAQNSYNYRIVAIASNGNFVDSSAAASNVRLELKPSFKQIELNWSANVPWSNNTLEYPLHDIYRGTAPVGTIPQLISDLTFIGSVNVNEQKFFYLDSGQYNATPLDRNTNYCYAVITRGSYGNPNIASPLINKSEITCTQPDDKVPPCKPVLALTGSGCEGTSFCPDDGHTGSAPFSNTIRWKKPSDIDCKKDIKGYYVYSSPAVGQTFTKLTDIVTDTFYVDTKLLSYAKCYKVKAVDRAGNESEFSDSFCFDNCPNYALPNVFTPNGDKCNDVFSALGIKSIDPDNHSSPCGVISDDHLQYLTDNCPRFVLSVDFTVYNRWGKEVYNYKGSYNSGEGPGVFINWNGKDSGGHDLDAGTYYYIANVVFDVVDPKNRNKAIKGWVLLQR